MKKMKDTMFLNGSKKTGYLHEETGTPCQDFFAALERNEDDLRCAVLCDGVSLSENSEFGAKWISQFAAEYFCDKERFEAIWKCNEQRMWTELYDFRDTLFKRLDKSAGEHGQRRIFSDDYTFEEHAQSVFSYATTLQVAAVCQQRLIYCRIGNGCTVLSCGGKAELILPYLPIHDATPCMTTPEFLDTLESFEWKRLYLPADADSITMFTDGLEFWMLHNGEISRQGLSWIAKMQKHPRQHMLDDLMKQVDRHCENDGDDLSAVYCQLRDKKYAPEYIENTNKLIKSHNLYVRREI